MFDSSESEGIGVVPLIARWPLVKGQRLNVKVWYSACIHSNSPRHPVVTRDNECRKAEDLR